MIPSNVDPRRPDKVQKFKPPTANGNNAPGDDLTPDYMNILGMYTLYLSTSNNNENTYSHLCANNRDKELSKVHTRIQISLIWMLLMFSCETN